MSKPAAGQVSDRIVEIEQLSLEGLRALDRTRVVAFWAISPIEVHGPHLPLGTDVRIAQRAIELSAERWVEADPDAIAVLLPPLPLGADVLPIEGSLEVSASVLEQVIVQTGAGLLQAGFETLVIGNNHGGPRHLLAIATARRALGRRGLQVVDPFGVFISRMLSRDRAWLQRLGLEDASTVGGSEDAHAGAFETSIALAAFEADVDAGHRELPPSTIDARSRVGALLRGTAGALERAPLGERGRRAGEGLRYVAQLLDWINSRPVPSFVGDPAVADKALGERALSTMAELTVELIERTRAGEDLAAEGLPLLWDLRALAMLPL